MQNTKVYYKQPPYFQQNIPIINQELIKNNAQMPLTPRLHSQSPPILQNQKQITFFPIQMTNFRKNDQPQIQKMVQNSVRPSIYLSPQGFNQKLVNNVPMIHNSLASQKPESISRNGSLTKIGDQISRISYLNVNTESAHSIRNRASRGQAETNVNRLSPIVISRPPSSLPQPIDSKDIIKNIQQKGYVNPSQNITNFQKNINARPIQVKKQSHSPRAYPSGPETMFPTYGRSQRPISNPKNQVKFSSNKIQIRPEPFNRIKNLQMRTSQVKVIYQRGSHSPNEQYPQLHLENPQERIPRPFSPKIKYVAGINPQIQIIPEHLNRKEGHNIQAYNQRSQNHTKNRIIQNRIICTPAQSIAGEFPKNAQPDQLKQEKHHIIKNSGDLALSSHIFSKPNQIQSNRSNSSSEKKRLNLSHKKQINKSNYGEQSNKKESFSSDNNYLKQDPIKQVESRDDFSNEKNAENLNRLDMKETVKPEKIVEVHHSQIPNQVSVKYKTQTERERQREREEKKSSKKSSSIKSNISAQIPNLYGQDAQNNDLDSSMEKQKQDSEITEKKSQHKSKVSSEKQKQNIKIEQKNMGIVNRQDRNEELKNKKSAEQGYGQAQMENISTIKQQSQQYEHQFQYSNSLIGSSMKREGRTDDLRKKEENMISNRSQQIIGKNKEKDSQLNKSENIQKKNSKESKMNLKGIEQWSASRRHEIGYRNNSFQQSIKLPPIITQPTQYTPYKINPFAMIQKKIEETQAIKNLNNEKPRQQTSLVHIESRKEKIQFNQATGINNAYSYNWQSNNSYRQNNQDNQYENRLENQVISQNQKTKININHHNSQNYKNASVLSQKALPKLHLAEQNEKQRYSAKNIPAEGNISREHITNQYSHHTHHHHHLHNYYGNKMRSMQNEEDQSGSSQREIRIDQNFYDLIDQIYNQQLERGLNRIRDVFNKTLTNGHLR